MIADRHCGKTVPLIFLGCSKKTVLKIHVANVFLSVQIVSEGAFSWSLLE